ncbi:hypothetical protein ARMSODRAFT_343861 [Armillaria solidipes]|uniref:F-box domain-containing protein n=1 Tax=Armillaria solidipes TaxID=1076256 RepID=A0A2H3BUP4_9AGAR|nr:hypothetical protein ARMSODRAFT_343861 [Armillaria solidipes]
MADLPQELVDLIMDELQDDQSTLIACSLASRSFYHPSRRYIFRQISLGPNSVDAFNTIIAASPDIPSHVHELSIKRGMRMHKDWAVYSDVLPDIITKCTNLRRLHLSKILWRKAPVPTLRSALENTNVTFLDIKSCRFTNYNDAALFFSHFPQLKRLSISGSLAEDDSLDCLRRLRLRQWSAPTKIVLDELDVDLMEGINVVSFLVMSDHVFALRRLRVFQWDSCDDSDMLGIRVILRAAALKHVGVGRCCCDRHRAPIDIQRLQSLTISFTNYSEGILPAWITVFQNTPAACPLKVLTFLIVINWECELSTLSHKEPWIALDAALTRKEFSGLRRVVFKISFVRNTPFMIVGAAKGAIEASCTRLASAGIMSVEVSNEPIRDEYDGRLRRYWLHEEVPDYY